MTRLRGGTNRRNLRTVEQDIHRRGQEAGERARGIEEHTDDFRRDFSGSDVAREAAGAAFEDFREEHTRGIENLRGEQVSMGRLRTGFGTEDEDRLTEDFQGRLAREIARGAFTGASLDLRNIEGFAGEGTESRRASDSALAGERDVLQARENERKRRRRGILGTLGGVVGGIAGSVLGPAGTALGSRLGSWVAGEG
jgi:hypothetical protein